MTSISLYSKTPSVTVLDNRGLAVRDIAWHRHPDTPDKTDERITRQQYDARGLLMQSIDPRLYALQQTDSSIKPNFTYLAALSGEVLRTESTDAGTAIALNDAAGRPALAVNADAVTFTFQYESSALPGRPLSVTEKSTDGSSRLSERCVYAANGAQEKALNLAGQCVSHYDTAGLVQTDSVALTGVPLSVTRRLLRDADNPDTVADWQGTDASAWNDVLATETFTTLSTADATGAVLTTTDARGNVQRVTYDVAGLLSGSWLALKDGNEQVIVKSLTYSAAGQKLREEHGNGVVTTWSYEPETQRLTGIRTERPAGHASGAKVLQDLRYQYDPAGNVLKITNDAEETRFWRNQKVVPENTCTYDSLYQLVSATGREMAGIARQGSTSPAVTAPLATDSSAFTSYTRTYAYDAGGNLTQIRHSAPATNNNYTTDITVSNRSNRGVLSGLTENPAQVDALFTAGGQQQQLQPGQNLLWTPRNELLKVTPVTRDGNADDSESYRYDAGSQRILKVSTQQAGNSTQTQRVLYLAGLELRSTTSGSTEKENLHVITVGEAGRAQVRALHWENGKPDDISNDQLRYSYDNLLGSSGLELDGDGNIISLEEYYPYGGTAVWTARSAVEADYKTVRYSGKERDATGLYYYGYRYYQPWAGRWLSADPAGAVDGLNLFRMVRNNPVTLEDKDGLQPEYRGGDEKMLLLNIGEPVAAGIKEIKVKYPKFYKIIKEISRTAENDIINTISKLQEDLVSGEELHPFVTPDLLPKLKELKKHITSYLKNGENFSQHVIFSEASAESKARAFVDSRDKQKRIFWNEAIFKTSTNSISHTFIHELTHTYLGTEDYFYLNSNRRRDLISQIEDDDFLYDLVEYDSNALGRMLKNLPERSLDALHIRDNRLAILQGNADTLAGFIVSYGASKKRKISESRRFQRFVESPLQQGGSFLEMMRANS